MPDIATARVRLSPPTAAFALPVFGLVILLLAQWWVRPVPRHPAPVRAMRGRVLINEASRSTLTLLPGIGPATAGHITAYRRQHGRFTSPRQLEAVPGIGPVRRRTITPWLTFADPTGGDEDGIRLTSNDSRPP